jgi:ribosomal-protein-alanine N-acetyltransferase
MTKEDISQVNQIDHEAFPTLWPPPNYRRELANRIAHYIVVGDDEKKVRETEIKATPVKGFSSLGYRLRRLFGHDHSSANELTTSERQYIFGFAGLWIMAGEAHIINIAVREQYRRQGIGELLLISLIDLAIELGAHLVTLEVRASNTTAQSLYAKYGFNEVGVRRGYYTDNREDGVLMSLENITSAPVKAKLQQLKQAHSRKWGIAASLYQAFSPIINNPGYGTGNLKNSSRINQ